MIPYSKQSVSQDDIDAVNQVLRSNFLTQGPKIEEFEFALADYFGSKYAICCSSGSSALHLAYAGLGAEASSIAIVPAVTFSATANAFKYLGSKVIFCDIDPETGLLSIEHLEEILSDLNQSKHNQKGFITPVSFAGMVAPLQDCREISNKYGFHLIEDASHSFGATNEKTDRSGDCERVDASCLSFHPVKHICCGEGGAILTNSSELNSIAKRMRSHGIHRPHGDDHATPWYYEQVELGWNYRMTDIQAALGISQLKRVDQMISMRRKIAQRYDDVFQETEFQESFARPIYEVGHSWHLYIIRFHKKGIRDEAHKFLKNRGILTQVHYVPLYKHPYYEKENGKIQLPGAEQYFEGCLSIPIFPDLREEEQERIITELRNFIEKGN